MDDTETLDGVEERIMRAYTQKIENWVKQSERSDDYPCCSLMASYIAFLECAEKRRQLERT